MDNTDPLPNHQPDAHEHEGGDGPDLELHSPNISSIEYADKRDARVIAILTFLGTLQGKVVLGVAAALIVAGTVWHLAHHRKPAAHPVTHVQATSVAPKHM